MRSKGKLATRESRWKEGYYFRKLVRNSAVKENARSKIEKYGTIQNMAGYGNCSIYSIMEGLNQAMIESTMGVNTLREEVYNYVLNNTSLILTNISFTNRRKKSGELRGMTRNAYINTHVMQRIWSRYVDFKDHEDEKYWVYSSLHLPAFDILYHTHSIWFDLN